SVPGGIGGRFRFGSVFSVPSYLRSNIPFSPRTRPITPSYPGVSQLTAIRDIPPPLIRKRAISVAYEFLYRLFPFSNCSCADLLAMPTHEPSVNLSPLTPSA